jgi:4-hydroxy-tetrahydrodipicolinate reductase
MKNIEKLAIIGRGKTGSKVIELATEKSLPHEVFSTSNPVTLDKLAQCDIGICFLTGENFLEIADTLIEAKLPMVIGATGFDWPEEKLTKLKENNLSWIHGHNFALGMNLVHAMISTLSKTKNLFDQFEFSIHDIHHTKKIDSPSGTAIKWRDWLGLDAEITAERTGDVVGEHYLTLKTPFETIELNHKALDRKIFAAGAIWGAQYLKNNSLEAGLHHFEDIAKKAIL